MNSKGKCQKVSPSPSLPASPLLASLHVLELHVLLPDAPAAATNTFGSGASDHPLLHAPPPLPPQCLTSKCEACHGAANQCERCETGYYLTRDRKCIPFQNGDANCNCRSSPQACDSCRKGYSLRLVNKKQVCQVRGPGRAERGHSGAAPQLRQLRPWRPGWVPLCLRAFLAMISHARLGPARVPTPLPCPAEACDAWLLRLHLVPQHMRLLPDRCARSRSTARDLLMCAVVARPQAKRHHGTPRLGLTSVSAMASQQCPPPFSSSGYKYVTLTGGCAKCQVAFCASCWRAVDICDSCIDGYKSVWRNGKHKCVPAWS